MTNIYLDIDGVLLANETHLAPGVAEFLKYAVEHFDVYWLTTHCMDGTTEHAVDYVLRASGEELRPWLERIRPVKWSLKKTEAIDFSQDFLWFDDDCFSGERDDLRARGATNSWIEVDLRKYPNQMQQEIKLLQSLLEGGEK